MAQWSREDSLQNGIDMTNTNMDQHIHTGSPSSGVSKKYTLQGDTWPSPNVAWAGVVSVPWAKIVGICALFSQCGCKKRFGRVLAKQELHPVGELLVEARQTTPPIQ